MKRCMITLNEDTHRKLGDPKVRMFLGAKEEFYDLHGALFAKLNYEFDNEDMDRSPS